MKKIILILLMGLSLIEGCENRRISHDVQQLIGSKIKFPQSLGQEAGLWLEQQCQIVSHVYAVP